MVLEAILTMEFSAFFAATPSIFLLFMFVFMRGDMEAFIRSHYRMTNNVLMPIGVSFFLLMLANVFELLTFFGSPLGMKHGFEILSFLLMGLGEWIFIYMLAVHR